LRGLKIIEHRESKPKPKRTTLPSAPQLTKKDMFVLGVIASVVARGEWLTEREIAKLCNMPRSTYRDSYTKLLRLGVIEFVPAKVIIHADRAMSQEIRRKNTRNA
jgi:RIO-like serine/threonine protein kinase